MKTYPVHRVFTCTDKESGLPSIVIDPFSSGRDANCSDPKYAEWVPEGETKYLSKEDFRFYTLKWFRNGLRETMDDGGNVVQSEEDASWEAFILSDDCESGGKEYAFTDGKTLQISYSWDSGASVLETFQ